MTLLCASVTRETLLRHGTIEADQDAMEDIAFGDWPGQPADLSGSNPWLPAYGYQQPTTLLEKEDFLGHPDADLFLHANLGQHYAYLETIQEETSDDLQSESDICESRAESPAGWLATDSETGSVIRIQSLGTYDSSSEREIACPSKRRKQDTNLLCVSDDDSSQSLSRSSSLIQFESLEKQCQDISSSSPSIFSNFSYDSLETHAHNHNSPDSLDKSYSSEPESDYYKSLKIDLTISGGGGDRSDSSDTTESEDTLEAVKYDSCKSVNNLKSWRSFDGLQGCNNVVRSNSKVSSENLSEDSGYSDHFCQYNKNKSSSIPNIAMALKNDKLETGIGVGNYLEKYRLKNCKGFGAYDGDIFQNFTGNFGVSYQDLSVLDKYEFKCPLAAQAEKQRLYIEAAPMGTRASEFVRTPAKFNQQTSSEPDLLSNNRTTEPTAVSKRYDILSVPKDLNLLEHRPVVDVFQSVAAKNFDLADLGVGCAVVEAAKMERRKYRKKNDRISLSLKQKRRNNSSSDASSDNGDVHYKREGSYLEAMENMINMSDDEFNPCYRDKIKQSTIVEFDKQILKAISEQSIQASLASLGSVKDTLDVLFLQPIVNQSRNVKSTPNLTSYKPDDYEDKRSSMVDMPRKSSLVNRISTTSTSNSENDDIKTLTASTKSINGSTSSKGVHFCPVVAEVNWRDSISPEANRESSYSLSSTPRESPNLIRPEPRLAERAMSVSEPELQMVQIAKEETVKVSGSDLEYTFVPLKPRQSISQPNINRKLSNAKSLSGTQKETAYVDSDGVVYKHTHLGSVYNNKPTTSESSARDVCNSKDAPTTAPTHVSPSQSVPTAKQQQEATRSGKAVNAMDATVKRRDSKSKLGGFLSRIASFRFTKNKSDEKKKKKNNEQAKSLENLTGQRLATKEDYIYIPLKGPLPDSLRSKESSAGNCDDSGCISGKPPLPKMPPRVVGASVKRRGGEASAPPRRSPDRRTIDSGDALPQPMEPMGLIETDLDTEVTVITSGAPPHAKTRSLMNLGADGAPARSLAAPNASHHRLPDVQRPHKSMEFLLDKQNLKVIEPPENELQKGERVMSEHQLRVQRSLQKLTVPEWYKQAEVPREGFLLKKSPVRETRWTGTSSKTTSLSSLGSSTQSPLVLSPTPQNQPFVRWSTSKLNSTASSPCASTRSSFNTRQPNGSISPSSLRSSFNYRQPYMGWRSQERLTRPRTPAERLASTILGQNDSIHQQHQESTQSQESPEIQTSIKEVTSAIVHYVSGLKPEDGRGDNDDQRSHKSSSVSPRGSQKLCWLESSFVGTRPLDSPQTPMTLSESQSSTPVPPSSLRLDLQTHNDFTVLLNAGDTSRPSPGSTTLEDVLDSLLGLPSSTRAPSPSLQGRRHVDSVS